LTRTVQHPTGTARGEPMSKPTTVEFDLDRYLRNSKKVDLS
jgi:hypothetical protein